MLRNRVVPTVAVRTIETLRDAFQKWGHKPSEEMWKDLTRTVELLEEMARGRLPPKYYLNALATGVGKTMTIVSFVGELVEAEEYEHTGVLLCVPLKEEIRTLIENMAIGRDRIHVCTRDEEYNELGGCDDPHLAQVLITTQQMIESRLSGGKKFAELPLFHYRGLPRQVRIWDEALLPWEELVLTLDEIAALPKVFRKHNRDLADKVRSIQRDLEKLKSGETYAFPDLGVEYDDLRKDIFAQNERHLSDREAAYKLCRLSGNTVRLSHDNDAQLKSILWRDHLPDDFMPVMVFDASGRVRAMYEKYAKASGQLEVITHSEKRYEKLNFHHVNMGGGKSQWRRNTRALLAATAACITNEPYRECLVVHHKKEGKGIPDMPKALADLTKGQAKVECLTWGRHKQTNAFKHLDKVVLAGLLYLPQSIIEVRARASMRMASKEELAKDDFSCVEVGELKNDILQAVGRICVRRCEDDQAPSADIYIIAADKAGHVMTDLLLETFPGCKVQAFNPPGVVLRTWQKALDMLEKFFSVPDLRNHMVPFKELQHQLGIKYTENFNRDVRRNPRFKMALMGLGIEEGGEEGKYRTWFQKTEF